MVIFLQKFTYPLGVVTFVVANTGHAHQHRFDQCDFDRLVKID